MFILPSDVHALCRAKERGSRSLLICAEEKVNRKRERRKCTSKERGGKGRKEEGVGAQQGHQRPTENRHQIRERKLERTWGEKERRSTNEQRETISLSLSIPLFSFMPPPATPILFC